MIVQFDRSFAKSLSKLSDQAILHKTEKIILLLEAAQTPSSGVFISYGNLKTGQFQFVHKR